MLWWGIPTLPNPPTHTLPQVDLAVAPPDSSWAPTSEEMEAEAHRLVRVATDVDLQTQIGSSVFLDLLDFDKVLQWQGMHG